MNILYDLWLSKMQLYVVYYRSYVMHNISGRSIIIYNIFTAQMRPAGAIQGAEGGSLPDLEAKGGIWRAGAGGEYREAQPSGK